LIGARCIDVDKRKQIVWRKGAKLGPRNRIKKSARYVAEFYWRVHKEPLISQRAKCSRFGRAIDNAYLVRLSALSRAPGLCADD